MNKPEQLFAANGVRLTTVFAERFKRDVFSLYLVLPLQKETAAANALLSRVLTHGSEKFPTLYHINRELDRLYGASLSSHVMKFGEQQVLQFSLTAIKGRFTFDGKDISMACVNFLFDILLHPFFVNGKFSEAVVENERKNLIDEINGIVNDKRAYALRRMLSQMCRNEAFGILESGTAEDVRTVTQEALLAAWQRVVKEARIEIVAVGETDRVAMAEAAAQAFASVERSPIADFSTEIITEVNEITRLTEEMNVEQGKLVMGFRTGVAAPQDTMALAFANSIFGSGVSSKLFLIVREQMHLCYYCASRVDAFKGILYVQSGVDAANAERAEAAILDQLNAVKQGDFTEKDQDAARVSMRNSYLSVEDDPALLQAWYFRELLRGTLRTPQEVAKTLEGYTKAELVNAFSGVSLDTVYLLKGNKS